MVTRRIITERSLNPFRSMPLRLVQEINREESRRDPEVRQFVEDVYFVDDWRKCKIPERLKPYVDEE